MKEPERICCYCGELFKPLGRERMCPECRLDRNIEREEEKESKRKADR